MILTLAFQLIAAASPAAGQSFTMHATAGPAAVRTLGKRDRAWQVGGGAEKQVGQVALGAGADYVYFPAQDQGFDARRTRWSSPAVGALMLAANASFRPRRDADRRLQPFVAAGVAWLADDEIAMPMLQFGGGVDWWVTPRTGLRFEVREQFPSMLAVRGGVVFR